MTGLRALAGLATLVLTLGATMSAPALAGVFGSGYTAQGKCGPYARAAVTTPAWGCLGIVAGPDDGLVMPRNVLELAPGRLLVVDMGGWAKNRGRLIEVRLRDDGGRTLTTLIDGLDRPHGLAMGPDGKVYVGEAGRIFRFDPKTEKISRETVIDGLPDEGRHPLKHFVFDTNGDMIVNIGAPSDRCEKIPNAFATAQFPCAVVAGDKPQAALYRLHFDRLSGKLASFKPIARGLRNSMAIAIEPKSGLIVQAENNIDYPGENTPPEELNVIVEGRNYGWPYCIDNGDIVRDYASREKSCTGTTNPAALMPAHGAPLGMFYYHGAMFPELEGKLIVGLHGYRANGHRLLAYDRKPDGTPVAPKGRAGPGFPFQIIADWDSQPGVHPRGAPVNVVEGADGRIWFTEDKNRTLMVFLRGAASAAADRPLKQAAAPVGPPPAGWAKLSTVIAPTCSQCHESFRARTPAAIWSNLVQSGFADPTDLRNSPMVHALRGEAPLKPMPPPGGLGQIAGGEAALADFLAGHK